MEHKQPHAKNNAAQKKRDQPHDPRPPGFASSGPPGYSVQQICTKNITGRIFYRFHKINLVVALCASVQECHYPHTTFG